MYLVVCYDIVGDRSVKEILAARRPLDGKLGLGFVPSGEQRSKSRAVRGHLPNP